MAPVLLAALATAAAADFASESPRQWHQWRGPRADGTAPHADPPVTWSESNNVQWKVPIPGEGSGTPVIWGDQVFLLTAVRTERTVDVLPAIVQEPPGGYRTERPKNYYRFDVLSLDRRTGRIRWRQTATEAVPHEGRHGTNSYASASAVTDGRRVYASFGSRGIYCYDMDGNLQWQRDLGRMITRLGWGEGASPALYADSLVVNWDHEGQSFLVVLDARTGETRWRVERDEVSNWSTPLVVPRDGGAQVVVNATRRATGYDLATGEILWECGGQTTNVIPSPVLLDDTAILMSGFQGTAAYAVPLDSRGDITGSNRVAWHHAGGTPYVPSPLLLGDRLYFTRGNTAVLTCLDARTGRVLAAAQRLPGLRSLYASPVAAQDRIYLVSREGAALVIKDQPELDILATNHLDDGFDASPAMVGRQLFLRGKEHLYCIAEREPLNLLIITVDDMSTDSVGAFGCPLPGTTPHLDRLAAAGMRFERAHVVAPNCMPSRNVMWSGLYPHANGVEGFEQVPDAKHPHLADLMQQAGYFTAIQHKVAHSTPYAPYPAWDLDLSIGPDGRRRDVKAPKSYGEGTAQGIAAAKEAGKPFCLVINIADPHKPFYAEHPRTGETVPDRNVPSRVFTPGEVPVPGFLFDDPVVRKELAHYYSTVRRADDAVGEVLAALEASGMRENTAVVFLSDHGMPLPFAKTQIYHHGTWTPLIFVVPGVTKPGTADDGHMVSAVDLLPTLLDVAGVPNPGGMQGRSFAPLLSGEKQDGRDAVFKVHNLNAGGVRNTMRAVQTQQYLYLFNPWSDGRHTMATATRGTPTYRRMARLAKTDPALAARHDLFLYRVPEELYDVANDPDCLENLIDAPAHQEALAELRRRLEAWMVDTKDPAVKEFREQVRQP